MADEDKSTAPYEKARETTEDALEAFKENDDAKGPS